MKGVIYIYRYKIPIEIIKGAIEGDSNSIRHIIDKFAGYINTLATTYFEDEFGNRYVYINDETKKLLEAKLIYSIIKKFKIR